MPNNTFNLLARFLDLHQDEVGGRAVMVDGPLRQRLGRCARGSLTQQEREVLCGEIRNNPAALAVLAQEIQAAMPSAKRKETAHDPRTTHPAA